MVQKVLKKMEDVNAMCERRRHSFQADIHNRQPSTSGPVRAVHPKDRSTADRPEIKAKVNNDSANKPLDIYHKSARVSDKWVKLMEITNNGSQKHSIGTVLGILYIV